MNRNTKIKMADIVLSPLVYPAGRLLKWIRMVGVANMPRCKQALMKMGVFPIWNHYHEPLFDSRILHRPLDIERNLPGIDWSIPAQLCILEGFDFAEEMKDIPRAAVGEGHFHIDNESFTPGDAELLYNLIRLKKPARIFEIGSGYSTLMARKAILKNRKVIGALNYLHHNHYDLLRSKCPFLTRDREPGSFYIEKVA